MSIFHLHKLQRDHFALQPPGMKAIVPVQPAAPLGTGEGGREAELRSSTRRVWRG